VPILKQYNFDGIDIDIETGLTGSGSITTLSTSQANLIRIIDGVLAQMPSNFGLTMAPETAYVTGGSVTYGSIWGAYLPIVKKYADNGRLWWLNMQYYNGSMYGCSGDSYSAGHGAGLHRADHSASTTGWSSRARRSGCRTTSRSPACRPVRRGRRLHVAVAGLPGLEQRQRPGPLKGLMTWSINWDGSKAGPSATT
jgi:chitinase